MANIIDNGNLWTSKQILDVVMLSTLTVLPLVPLLGYQLNQARRLFRTGHTLADLRTALDVATRERSEGEVSAEVRETSVARLLRAGFYGAATWGAVTLFFDIAGVVHERTVGPWVDVVPFVTTIARRLGAPERTSLTGASAFRATEAALGVAAAELFAALPKAYREQLAEAWREVEDAAGRSLRA